jgi:hypothetical protein
MKTTILAIALSALVLNSNAKDADSPWQSLSVREQTVVATLPKDRRWLVTYNKQEPRLSAFGKSFSLRVGDSLTLSERHSSYTFTPRFVPHPPGLECVYVLDARSFGGGTERSTSFFPAR